ncbi:MAG: ATP-grasp domain-containing protein [Armatimonadota bacterium]
MSESRKIGLMVGREESFPAAFIEHVNRRGVDGVTAELALVGGSRLDDPRQYAVLIDRISHEVPYYRGFLKYAALAGTAVINNPFWWSADEKFFGTAVVARLGVAVPRTVLLPNKAYIEDITAGSLRNLMHPLPWEDIIEYVGFPAILKPNTGGGFKHVYKVNTMEELWRCYDQTGLQTMILQEFIEFDHYVRCICIGRREVMPIRWDPRLYWTERYIVDHQHLTPELGARVVHDARLICEVLGYDMNTVEFAIRDNVPYAIDFLNPAPDFERVRIRDIYFGWVIEKLADLAIDYALGAERPPGRLRWDRFLRDVATEA